MIWTAKLASGVSHPCFADVVRGLTASLRGLGYSVVEGTSAHPGQVIVIGANVFTAQDLKLIPKNAIIYQLEQFGTRWFNAPYINLLREHTVWDFSPRNVAGLRRLGCPRVHLCRVGFSPQPVEALELKKDIDVLFFGSRNARRDAVLHQLRARGVVVHDSGGWGEERRQLVARSKVVLNLHYYSSSVLEMVRLGPILEQGAFIVSERGADPEMELPLEQGMKIVPYANVVETIIDYLNKSDERVAIAKRGTELFRVISQRGEVDRCLAEMNHPRPQRVKCYIVNRDRLTWTRNTVREILRLGGEPIIVDNASTYPPLIEWYSRVNCRVIRTGKNLGARAPWLAGIVDREVRHGEKYVVTDPDLDLSSVPDDALTVLAHGLDRHDIPKAGLSLEIQDVPTKLLACLQVNGKTLRQCEEGYWREKLDDRFWRAAVDTTFAMYCHGRAIDGEKFYHGVRADRPYTAKHLPWYRSERDFDDEDRYYVAHREKMNGINGTWYDSVVRQRP